MWLSGTVQARDNVSMLTTHADVYIRILICECMPVSTIMKPDHAWVLKGQDRKNMCVSACDAYIQEKYAAKTDLWSNGDQQVPVELLLPLETIQSPT